MDELFVKKKVYNFFKKELYNERVIPKHHLDIIQDFEDEFDIHLRLNIDRNYSHSTGFLIILNSDFGIIGATNDFLTHRELKLLHKTKGNWHWGIYFELSLVTSQACYTINKREISNNDIELNDFSDLSFPKEAKKSFEELIHFFQANNYEITNSELLSETKKNWVNSLFSFKGDYSPNLYDLLFGSVQFYTEAGI